MGREDDGGLAEVLLGEVGEERDVRLLVTSGVGREEADRGARAQAERSGTVVDRDHAGAGGVQRATGGEPVHERDVEHDGGRSQAARELAPEPARGIAAAHLAGSRTVTVRDPLPAASNACTRKTPGPRRSRVARPPTNVERQRAGPPGTRRRRPGGARPRSRRRSRHRGRTPRCSRPSPSPPRDALRRFAGGDDRGRVVDDERERERAHVAGHVGDAHVELVRTVRAGAGCRSGAPRRSGRARRRRASWSPSRWCPPRSPAAGGG